MMARGGGSWRDIARPIIQSALLASAGKPEAEIKRALFAAYPFHERRYWPYKVWLDEIKIQRGQKRASFQAKANAPPDPRQIKLFDERGKR